MNDEPNNFEPTEEELKTTHGLLDRFKTELEKRPFVNLAKKIGWLFYVGALMFMKHPDDIDEVCQKADKAMKIYTGMD